MYQRPKRGESEEDLLKLQEEFFKNKSGKDFQPAAKLVTPKQDDTAPCTSNLNQEIVDEQLGNTFEDIPKNIRIGNIVEKKVENTGVVKLKFPKHGGFPQAKRRIGNDTGGKGSLFAQQFKKAKAVETMEVESAPINSSTITIKERKPGVSLPTTSFILTGDDKEDIHKENLDIMSKLTEQEILEEREKLLEMMDPAIIAFLKSKRTQTKQMIETRQPTIAEQNIASEDLKLEEIQAANEILTKPEADKWLNFDVLETGKLAWMKDIDIPKIQKDKQYEARFDFGGWLLPYNIDEINESNRVLYHHGDEPGRPGYTLQELFQLCRSSVIQQKIVALNTISNVLNLHSSGIYNGIIDIPIEQIFFVVRFCLDENSPATLNASIKAMRALFYYPIDETCLDSMLGFAIGYEQPILALDNNEKEDDNTVNDQQLAESNLIKCLGRTDILVRIRYIFNAVKPSLETIVYCLEILIRLCRDSDFMVKQVCKCDGLIQSVVDNFIPQIFKTSSNDAYGLPIHQAIKLLRILAARSKNIAEELILKYKILDAIVTYISNDFISTNSNGLKLQIESFHLWSTIINYNLGMDYFKVLQPILLRLLNYHLYNTNANDETSFVLQAHTAACLNLLAETSKHNCEAILAYVKLILDIGLNKWCTQFCLLKQFSCGKLQIVASLANLLANLIRYCPQNVHLPLQKIFDVIDKLIQSGGFDLVTNNLKLGSNILNNFEAHKSSANLNHMEAAIWNAYDHVTPVIQSNSSLPFLLSLSKLIEASNNKALQVNFINHEHIKSYLNLVQKADKYYLTSNWFTKIESQFIINVLKIAVHVQDKVDVEKYYEITVKTLSIYNALQKTDIEYLLKHIVFSKRFYPSDVLMKNLNIVETNDVMRVCLDKLDDILEVYSRILGLRNNEQQNKQSLSMDIKLGNIMPIDWIYSPIIVLYSNQQQNKLLAENDQIYIVTNCLRWIYIYETYFPSLALYTNPTDRFCRLACTFLGSDSLFLIPEVRSLLELCLRHILTHNEAEINFNKPIHGLNNFQDFYTQLLEQYQGVSYGDKLFGQFILIPLAQRHNVKLRKTLWSEYAGVLQILNVKENELLCPAALFLGPLEDDISLVRCYKKAIASNTVRKDTILYKIADYHSKNLKM